MHQYFVLRILTPTLKILAACALVATTLVVLAIVGSGVTSPASIAPLISWGVTIALATMVAMAGLLAAILLYAGGAIIGVLLAMDRELEASLVGAGEQRTTD